MTDDRRMAELLGEAPRTPDPAFRVEVFARMAGRARRRAALDRGVKQMLAFSLLGFIFPAAQALGFTWEAAQPLLLTGGVLALAYLLAALAIQGPRQLLARSRGMLRSV
jgi:hypothetical protein